MRRRGDLGKLQSRTQRRRVVDPHFVQERFTLAIVSRHTPSTMLTPEFTEEKLDEQVQLCQRRFGRWRCIQEFIATATGPEVWTGGWNGRLVTFGLYACSGVCRSRLA